jgi:GTP-binding protein HflX
MKSIRTTNNKMILISDTVGFIQKIPHELIAAFRATLEEVIQAHLLLHVIDISNPNVDEQIEAVRETVRELGVDHKPLIHVFNKVDLLENETAVLQSFRNRFGEAVGISAETGEGIEELVETIAKTLNTFWQRVQLTIPLQEQSLIAQLHHQGKVYDKHYTDEHIKLDVEIPKKLAEKLRQYAHF